MNQPMAHLYLWLEAVYVYGLRRGCRLLALSLFVSVVNAQPSSTTFEHLSVQDGLSNNYVSCILQDQEGFMWFGTNNGLNRYDGYAFRIFQPNPARPNQSFSDNRVLGLCEDRKGHIWAVTEGGGLNEIDKKTGAVTPHPIRAEHANWWNNQLTVYEDHQGILWISSYAGLIRYEPAKHHFTLYPSPQRDVPVKSIFEDRQNRLWVATSKGLYQFNRTTGVFTLLPFQAATAPQPWYIAFYLDKRDMLWLGIVGQGVFQLDLSRQPLQIVPYQAKGKINPFVYSNTLHSDAEGFIWLGTTEGLQRIDPTTNEVLTYLPDPNALHSLSSANAQAVYHDRAGTLWVGTNNGIDKQAVNTKPFTTYQVRSSIGNSTLPENKVYTLNANDQNQVWFSNQDRMYRLDLEKKRIIETPKALFGNTPEHRNYIHAFLPDGPATVWIATWDGLFKYNPVTNQSVKIPLEIRAQFISRDQVGNLWIAGEGGVVSYTPGTNKFKYYKYNPADTTAMPEKYIYGMLISRTGDIWLSIRSKGLSKLNPKTGQFTRYTANSKPGQLNSNEVGTMYEDKAGTIWMGTTQGGLNWYTPETKRFSHVTTRDGLLSNWIVGIIEDNRGNLWVATNKGLCRYNPRTQKARSYDSRDNLPSNEFMVNAVSKSQNALLFGTLNGLIRFNPDSIRDDTQPFPVYITGLKVKNKSRLLTDAPLTLNYNENFLSFDFVALTYGLPERSRFAYQLVGIDNDWVQNGSRRIANYTNLPPGEYTFMVKAANSDGFWRTLEKPVSITILAPWWQTWPAYFLYGLLLIGTIWGFIRYRSRQLLAANRRLESIVANRTAEVRRQSEQIIEQRDSLEKTLTKLTATQRQLIHKEKMASLGELTAGIAHEIQNPLNFVNNFSEVSVELANDLLDELTAGRQKNAVELAENLQTNLKKITHHGKRADAIVKNMLQHARSSTGQKQPTDINKLVAEHLRLAYQGIRAKDKSVNINLVMNLDPTLELVQVVPQDMGRVLLNLFNNAFYSVTAKGEKADPSYEPELIISSCQVNDTVELHIRDNGLGIPQSLLDKVYQPFFTTKPTGQGTGLGLSLSYDIITKGHDGELIVETQEGQFAEFIIKLPISVTS